MKKVNKSLFFPPIHLQYLDTARNISLCQTTVQAQHGARDAKSCDRDQKPSNRILNGVHRVESVLRILFLLGSVSTILSRGN